MPGYLLLFLLALLVCGCGGGEEDEPLVVGLDPDFPPFEGKDENGRLEGVSIELARAIGRDLGRPVEFREIAFDGLIPALRSGQLDLVISSLTRTEERDRVIDFSDPYARIDLLALVPVDGARAFRDVVSGDGTVVVINGTTGQLWAVEHLPEKRIRVVEQADAAAAEVATGRAEAWIYDALSVLRYQERHADQTRVLATPVRGDEWAIGLREGDDELREKVDEVLAELRRQRVFADWQGKHLRADIRRAQRLGLPFDVFAVEPAGAGEAGAGGNDED